MEALQCIGKIVQEFLENMQNQVKLHGNKQQTSILGKITEKFSTWTFNSEGNPHGKEHRRYKEH